MDVKTLYDKIGGDYAGTLARFLSEERMARFALRFLSDDSYAQLLSALENGDRAEAFRAAHTLKGVCQNLGFDYLYEPAHTVTEVLRAGDFPEDAQMRELARRYEEVITVLRSAQE